MCVSLFILFDINTFCTDFIICYFKRKFRKNVLSLKILRYILSVYVCCYIGQYLNLLCTLNIKELKYYLFSFHENPFLSRRKILSTAYKKIFFSFEPEQDTYGTNTWFRFTIFFRLTGWKVAKEKRYILLFLSCGISRDSLKLSSFQQV